MELRDTVGERDPAPAPVPAGGGSAGRDPIDRFQMKPQWTERSEEERVEEAESLYEKAVRQWTRPEPPDPAERPKSEEELMAMTQELKLRQMCQGIAAQIMVDELEEDLDEEEEPRPKKRQREG